MPKAKFVVKRDSLTVAVMTLAAVATWTFFEIFRTLTQSETPTILSTQTRSLNPKLPLTTLDKLEKRITFTEEELNEITVFVPEGEAFVETSISQPTITVSEENQNEATISETLESFETE